MSLRGLTPFLFLPLALGGCGYSSQAILPNHLQTVYVRPFDNRISITGEVSEKQLYKVYRPGLEVQLTDAIANRLHIDSGLRLAGPTEADAELSGALIEYQRQGLRFDEALNITEFRANIIANVRLKDLKNDRVLWESPAVVGDSTHFTEGPVAVTEDQAINAALQDLAVRVAQKVATAGW